MLRRSRMLLVIIFAAIVGTGCANPGQYVDRPNAGNGNNPARIVNAGNSPLGGTTNPGGDADAVNFEAMISIQHYSGVTTGTQVTDIRVARHKTDKKQLRISAPNLNTGQAICVITGVQFDSDPFGFGSFFLDIGEERCGTIPQNEATFTMVRDDFNVVTIVLQDDLDLFKYWATDSTAPANSFPSMSQGIIDDLMPYPVN